MELVNELSKIITQPQSRLNWVYWITGGVIVGIWVSMKIAERKPLISRFFAVDYWFNRSARQDLFLVIFNQALFVLFGIVWSLWVLSISIDVFQGLSWIAKPDFLESEAKQITFTFISIYSAALFLFDDCSRYALHRLMHSMPFLWRIHRVHHSANHLTPVTFFRVHPLEKLLYQLRSVVVHGTSIGIGFYYLGQQPEAWLLFGVNATVILFNSAGAILRHSEFAISFGKFEYFFISPFQHQIHHSIVGQRANFGSVLSIWDRVFGSFVGSHNKRFKDYPLPKRQEPLIKQLLLQTELRLK